MQVTTTTSATGPVPGLSDKAALQKVAQQFEAVFLRQMIGAMRSASLAEGISDSSATQQFQDMADARTADAMAGKGAMGIAALLIQQFGDRVKDAPAAPDAPNAAARYRDSAA
ncbi:rod-binding protein [Sphingobium sp. HBC34]|uniref:Rod-binding protein n=1 Tax=Sphingobium cyanobacteriorum TaxID=3063954 RepID=A0ABT8ZI50_9SPHN|nr:rod-binding protein [Sphingobium sp. HBC34]MDO7834106.1 rod-binding protein [Sphingobium sp. HBC34]